MLRLRRSSGPGLLTIVSFWISFWIPGSLAPPAFAEAPASAWQQGVARSLEVRALRGAEVAVLVSDADSGAVWFERDADEALVPASNMKVLTALAMGEAFGPSHRFVTPIHVGALPDAEGTVPWLSVRGSGDPSLTSEQWWRLAADLARLGVRRIAGPIHLDGSAFDGERWHPSWGTPTGRAYFGPVGALAANYGAFAVVVEPGVQGQPARVRIDPPTPYLRLMNQARTAAPGGKPNLAVHRKEGAGVLRVIVTGTIPARSEPETIYRSVLDPTRYAGAIFAMQLEALGIALDAPVSLAAPPAPGILLHEFEGHDMGHVLRLLGKYSSNFIAEALVKALGVHDFGGVGTWEVGMEAMRTRLAAAGLDLEDARVVDGSGLSRRNRVSPRLLVEALRASRRSFRAGPEIVASFPIAGADGTLEKRAGEAVGAVRAKTGLLNGVTALSGFAERADGRVAAFSILVNGFQHGAPAARAAVDGFVEALVR